MSISLGWLWSKALLPLSAQALPAQTQAVVQKTGAGFVINGSTAGDYSGFSVRDAGDVNGDGIPDVIVGAYGADPNGQSGAGRSYVVFGKRNTRLVALSQLEGVGTFASP